MKKIFSAEIGYGFKSRIFSANLNAYFTKWLDKTTTKTGDYTTADGADDRFMLNMAGVNAKHMGVELDLKFRPFRWLDVLVWFLLAIGSGQQCHRIFL